jgi:hypothetical protein
MEANRYIESYIYNIRTLSVDIKFIRALETSQGADKYETGTNAMRTTKKTPLTKFMKGEK